eukprot:588816-Pelagomonas_calceolata.AAC.3
MAGAACIWRARSYACMHAQARVCCSKVLLMPQTLHVTSVFTIGQLDCLGLFFSIACDAPPTPF